MRTGWTTTVPGTLAALSVAFAAHVFARGESQSAQLPPRPAVLAEPSTRGGAPVLRRVNETQYKRAIEDIFGSGIKVPGRFEPPLREEGLLAIGDGQVTITPSGLEQYELRAREIAAQVLAENKRKEALPCMPQSATSFDKACATTFVSKYGKLLFRRPLANQELTAVLGIVGAATDKTGSFYRGLEFGLARLLASPHFIFRVERAELVPGNPGRMRLDAYSLATRLSFLIWNAPPDTELLDAAARGALHQKSGLEKQVDRLLASPRFGDGVRAFFSDVLAYEQFDGLSKDQSVYPKFTSQMAKDAEEQTLRTIVDLLVTSRGDYRDLFTTKKTFLNRNLGALYKVPVDASAVEGGWIPYTFGPGDERAGILTLAGFLMLDPTHEVRTSPTIRGKSVRELLLCQKVPPPPANVDFSLVQDTSNPKFKTVRDRLTEHRKNPACATCHAMMDPVGLSMENYDGLGNYRTKENGAVIDTSGTFENKSYKTMLEFAQLLHDSPTVTSCATQRVYEYGVGRQLARDERELLKYFGDRFAEDRYVFSSLVRRVATSRAFQAVAAERVSAN